MEIEFFDKTLTQEGGSDAKAFDLVDSVNESNDTQDTLNFEDSKVSLKEINVSEQEEQAVTAVVEKPSYSFRSITICGVGFILLLLVITLAAKR